mgnify:CR=1 FL=1
MKYKYNGNLEIEDRINEVCNDIKSEYNGIPIDKLKKIAALELPIIEPVNFKIKFRRLYNILLIINNDISLSSIYEKVLKDLINVYNSIPKDEIDNETEIIDNILKFKNNNGEKFYIY